MEFSSLHIDIKKILLMGLQQKGHSVHDVMKQLLQESHSLTEKGCTVATVSSALKSAAEYIFAYLELGFSYLEHRELFDHILSELGYTSDQLSTLYSSNEPVTLTASRLRGLIGRWPVSPYNSHTISAAIEDILDKCNRNCYGIHTYYTAKKGGDYTALYQLTVSPGYLLFCDVFRCRYYRLIKK